MTPDQQINAIVAGLAPWCKQYGGSVKIAHDVPHLFKVLGEAPGAVRAAVLWVGDETRDERNSDMVGRMDNTVWIAFSRGYNLESYAGKSLVQGIEGRPALFTIILAAKAAIRRLQLGTDDEPLPFYKNTRLLTFEGVTLDAYRIEIAVTSDDDNDLGDLEAAESTMS